MSHELNSIIANDNLIIGVVTYDYGGESDDGVRKRRVEREERHGDRDGCHFKTPKTENSVPFPLFRL